MAPTYAVHCIRTGKIGCRREEREVRVYEFESICNVLDKTSADRSFQMRMVWLSVTNCGLADSMLAYWK